VLASAVGDWFESDRASPYMLRIVRARSEAVRALSAVIHVDGTSRLHTVRMDDHPRLASLLELLVRRGHPPVVLNSSLNGRGEPLVHTAAQAFAFATRAELSTVMIEGRLFTHRREP